MNIQFNDLFILNAIPIAMVAAAVLFQLERIRRNKQLAAFADPHLLKSLLPETRAKGIAKLLFQMLFLALACLALSRPQWGFTLRESTKHGVDIAIALDVSESMLTRDMPPNRLERARREIFDLLGELKGDRVGLVTFAGAAFVETPLTLDYSAFRMFTANADTTSIPLQGTNIELAVRKSLELLGIKDGKTAGEAAIKRSRAIILLTDGEELDGDVQTAAKLLKDSGTSLYILGVGTPEGGPIVQKYGVRRDKQGQTIVSKLNEAVLQQFAEQAGGVYLRSVATSEDTTAIYENGIKAHLTDEAHSWNNSKIWNEYFQFPLVVALLILLFGVWREGRPAKAQRTSNAAAFILLLSGNLVFLAAPAKAENPMPSAIKGRQSFEKGDFAEALQQFETAMKEAPQDLKPQLAAGSAQYRLGKFQDAEQTFLGAAENSTVPPAEKGAALYNAGNSEVQLQKYEEAVKNFKQALTLRGQDGEVQENLKYAEKLLQEQKKKEEEDKKKNQQDQKQQDQQQKDPKQQQNQQQKPAQNQQQQSNGEPSQDKNEKPEPKEGGTPTPQPSSEPSAQPTPQASPDQEKTDQNSDGKGEQPNPTPAPQPSPEASATAESGDGEPTPDPTPGPEASPSAEPTAQGEEASDQGKDSEQKGKPSSATDEKGKPLTADEQALETLLSSIEEKSSPVASYRLREGLQQLKQFRQSKPQKDW